MKRPFRKRIFTASVFFRELGFLIRHLPGIYRVFIKNHDARVLYDKIVIITDAVNECAYCSWLDAKMAMRRGISEQEVKDMLRLQYHTSATVTQIKALLFAQHYAESNANPDPAMLAELFECYGEETANNIVLAIRAVTFGNLYFNTWAAVISRVKGVPAPDSNIIFEILFFLFNTIIILPIVIVRKLDKKGIGLKMKHSD